MELTPLYDPLYDQLAHTTLRPVELTPFYDQQAHTTLQPVELTPLYDPLYDQLAHTTLRPVELTPFYDQRAHTTLRPASSHHSMTSELIPLYNTLILTTTYAFTLTRRGLTGCLTALAYTDSVSPLKSRNLSTSYNTNPHTYYTYIYIHVAQTITITL